MVPKRPKFVKLAMVECGICHGAVPDVQITLKDEALVRARFCPKCDRLAVK